MRIAKTPRTVIELIRLADAPFFLELVNNPTWLKYIGDRNVHDVKAAEDYLTNGLLKQYEEKGYSYYVVRTNDKAIGICGFLKRPFLEHADFGFAYLPDFQRQGYGYEAGLAVLNYGAEKLGFEKLDAVTSMENTGSIRLLKNLGFTYQRLIDIPNATKQLRHYRWAGKR